MKHIFKINDGQTRWIVAETKEQALEAFALYKHCRSFEDYLKKFVLTDADITLKRMLPDDLIIVMENGNKTEKRCREMYENFSVGTIYDSGY